MYYQLKKNWTACSQENAPTANFVAIFTKKEAQKDGNIRQLFSNIAQINKEVPFTRAEVYENYCYGTVNIPSILNHETVQFIFIIEKDRLFLIANSEFLQKELEELLKIRQNNMTDVIFSFYYLLEYLVETDLEKLNLIQDQLSQLEKQIFDNIQDNYSRRLTHFRTKALQLSHYYLQLTAMIKALISDENHIFSKKHCQFYEQLAGRIALLKDEATQLWDYTSQVRELYQEQLDVRQNQIMKLLTIVTTLFFPLSLITGWYGMNFKYMPELEQPNSYAILIAISLAIVIILCIWFKKKKFW